MIEIILEVISAWQVVFIGLLVMIIFPIIFYFASFSNKPVKIKRVPVKRKKSPATANVNRNDEDEDEEYDDE